MEEYIKEYKIIEKTEIQKEIEQMNCLNGNQIVENRYMKFRNMGEFKEV